MKKKIKKGYKVVIQRGNNYYSYGAFFSLEKYYKIYKINQFVKRNKNCGPLAVFTNIKHVKLYLPLFNNTTKPIKIFKCEFIESENNYLYTPDLGSLHFWLPKGTKFAEEVKLIEEIKLYYKY